MKAFFFILAALTLFSCTNQSKLSSTKQNKLISGNCGIESISVKHAFSGGTTPWSRTLKTPAKGKFVEESHYVTTKDTFKEADWPSKKNESIRNHLNRSLKLYQRYDANATIDELYAQSWQKEWTPEEGGHFGQGSVGNAQLNELSPEMEMWFITMMWAPGERPERGTKFLLSANGKSVVVVAGYETGPASKKYLGGVTREVHYWLGTNANTEITLALLQDQSTSIGPVICR